MCSRLRIDVTNGQCIPRQFFRDVSIEADCLDQTDEPPICFSSSSHRRTKSDGWKRMWTFTHVKTPLIATIDFWRCDNGPDEVNSFSSTCPEFHHIWILRISIKHRNGIVEIVSKDQMDERTTYRRKRSISPLSATRISIVNWRVTKAFASWTRNHHLPDVLIRIGHCSNDSIESIDRSMKTFLVSQPSIQRRRKTNSFSSRWMGMSLRNWGRVRMKCLLMSAMQWSMNVNWTFRSDRDGKSPGTDRMKYFNDRFIREKDRCCCLC